MSKWQELADKAVVDKTVEALKLNGIEAEVIESGQLARERILELLPKGAEVMTMTSKTLEGIGVLAEINESGHYNSVRSKLAKMDSATQGLEMQKLGGAPEWVVGSVHGVTENGQVVIVSNTGSQLGAYAYGSTHVIWVVGTQKIVKDVETAMQRIYEYILPLESERLKKVYPNVVSSNVSKVLIVNKEVTPGRITLIFVKEQLGF